MLDCMLLLAGHTNRREQFLQLASISLVQLFQGCFEVVIKCHGSTAAMVAMASACRVAAGSIRPWPAVGFQSAIDLSFTSCR